MLFPLQLAKLFGVTHLVRVLVGLNLFIHICINRRATNTRQQLAVPTISKFDPCYAASTSHMPTRQANDLLIRILRRSQTDPVLPSPVKLSPTNLEDEIKYPFSTCNSVAGAWLAMGILVRRFPVLMDIELIDCSRSVFTQPARDGGGRVDHGIKSIFQREIHTADVSFRFMRDAFGAPIRLRSTYRRMLWYG